MNDGIRSIFKFQLFASLLLLALAGAAVYIFGAGEKLAEALIEINNWFSEWFCIAEA